MQELIRQRRRAGFVGRSDERAAFRANFDVPPEDERHRFLFHVHGDAGVGKTFLVRELEQLAREKGALTAYVDESVGSVPEAMATISRQFAGQGHRFKELDRLLATHRQRRHEAEAAAIATLEPEPEGPSAGSVAAARAGLVGLGMVPGVGVFAGALDADRLAQGADRLRAELSARFRNQEDVQLVLHPERVLTPMLLNELSSAASAVPWIALFFDTYERTRPFLDAWLHEVMTTDRHGALPATVVVVTAGQHPFDVARWGAFADFMADVPLGPFTDAEVRALLAGKGVVAEPVVAEVLRLTGGLPVLVSTLAEQRPSDSDDVGGLSTTAVERFLKWERDPVRRAVAMACALPRHLDMDVFRAAADCRDEGADELFGWLRSLPFVDDRGDRPRYHDLVREQMLRLQRQHSPRDWGRQHTRLAEVFRDWRTEVEAGREARELWADEDWLELRLAEGYHLLCAGARGALPDVLKDVVTACGEGEAVARRWVRTLAQAGADTEAKSLSTWGSELAEALGRGGTLDALGLLLARGGFDARGQAQAHRLRGVVLGNQGEISRALVELDRAVTLDPQPASAHVARAVVRARAGDLVAAITDLDRADELTPDRPVVLSRRGDYHRVTGNNEAAMRDLDRAIELDPTNRSAWAARGVTHHQLGQLDSALADLDRALELDSGYVWALVRRARIWRSRSDDRRLADLDRAVALAPGEAWVLCERGDALVAASRHTAALADYDRAIEIDGAYASAYASRGVCQGLMWRHYDALADLNRAIELNPEYVWALGQRARLYGQLGDSERALADTDRAKELRPDDAWVLARRGWALMNLERLDEARAELDRAVELNPDYVLAYTYQVHVLGRLGLWNEALENVHRQVAVVRSRPWVQADRALIDEAIQGLSDVPDTARARIAPILTQLTEARDAIRSRATE
ncbi:MAG: tetratricopeptide repeat protein [Streptomyces sp.]|nr:tetratricopeptide repeat protein [Streptomyces sp.]NUT25366.1 tetratricopeptide repeat protein [Streptomyces sp.]